MTQISAPRPELRPPLGSRDHLIGRVDAKINLCEYGDYQCPHCRRAQVVVRAVREHLGDELLFGFRHFPLAKMHPNARIAAEAAEAANAQGKFWEMHELLFAHQNELDIDHLAGFAGELGLDVDRFRTDVTTKVYAARVQEDLSSGIRSGVNGTPTFYVHNKRFNGGYDLDPLLEALQTPQ